LTSTYTASVVYQALLVAAEFAEKFEYPDDAINWRDKAAVILSNMHTFFNEERGIYTKGYLLQENGSLQFDNTLDISSIYGAMMFGNSDFDASMLTRSIDAVENILLNQSPSGGSPRYEHDHYFESNPSYLGNPWFVTTLWIAQYYIRKGNDQKAIDLVEWTLQHALPSGMLSEQVNPNNGSPLSVAPLVWSHAELINTILDLAKLK